MKAAKEKRPRKAKNVFENVLTTTVNAITPLAATEEKNLCDTVKKYNFN